MRRFLSDHPDACAVAALIALVTCVFFGVVFRGETFHERDLTVYHHPMKSIVREAMLSGEFPAWNPRYAGGQPLAANPAYELFYPPQWLILLPDYLTGFRLHILLHFYLAAIGMYAFIRSLGMRVDTALLAGLLYGLGGTTLSLVNLLPFLFSTAWIPLILLFARRFLRAPNRRDFAVAALLMGIQATLAEPVTLLQTWGLVGCYALYHAWQTRRDARGFAASLLLAAALGVAGAIVGAAQLVPAADHARDSVRSTGLTYELITEWSTPPARMRELLFPGMLRRLFDGETPRVQAFYRNGRIPFIADISVGVAGTLLLLASLLVWTGRTPWLLGGIAATWIIALGEHTPLWRMLYGIGVRSIRYPEKFLLPAFLLTVVLIAGLADRLFSGDRHAARIAFRITAGWIVIVAFIAVTAPSILPNVPPEAAYPHQVVGSERAFWGDLALRGAVVAAILFAMARRREWAVAALLLFAAIDLGRFRGELAPTQPREFFTPSAALTAPPGSRIFHVADWEWASNDPNALAYFSDLRRYHWMIRNGVFPNVPGAHGRELVVQQDFDETSLKPSAGLLTAALAARRQSGSFPPLLDSITGATHRAVLRPQPENLAALDAKAILPVELVATGDHPRFYFAEQIERVGGTLDFAGKLTAGSWSDRVAFVESEAFTPMPGSVTSSKQGWSAIDLEVESSGRSLLVLAVTPHKYWKATVDGQPAPIGIANVASMTVELGPGAHRVALRYRNPLVIWCGLLSAVAAAVLIALALVPSRRSGS